MRRAKLDKIDLKILKNLQDNGRITNVSLAKEVGISAPPCLRRVRMLEEKDYIQGYHANVNGGVLGYHVMVFAHVKLSSQADTDLKKFEALVSQWSRVREVHMLAGDMDFLLKIVAKDWDDYQTFLTEKLVTTTNVISVKSSLAIRSAKNKPGVPIEI